MTPKIIVMSYYEKYPYKYVTGTSAELCPNEGTILFWLIVSEDPVHCDFISG